MLHAPSDVPREGARGGPDDGVFLVVHALPYLVHCWAAVLRRGLRGGIVPDLDGLHYLVVLRGGELSCTVGPVRYVQPKLVVRGRSLRRVLEVGVSRTR